MLPQPPQSGEYPLRFNGLQLTGGRHLKVIRLDASRRVVHRVLVGFRLVFSSELRIIRKCPMTTQSP
jgi:hypothetical protein